MLKKLLVPILALILTSLAFAGCDTDNNAQGGERNTTLRLATVETFTTIDPHNNTRIVDNTLAAEIFEGFFFLTPFGELEPRLATHFEINDEGTVFTFFLREGVRFHNGHYLTSEDVLFSFARAKDSPPMFANVAPIESVVALDDLTVQITLENVDPMFQFNVNLVAIMSAQGGRYVGPGFMYPNIGTGPFMLVDWGDGMRVVMEQNPYWYLPLPQIETITRYVVTDVTAVLMAFEAGDIDYVGVPPADWDRIVASGLYTTYSQQTWHTTFMNFNHNRAPFDDVRVRQAFNYAINPDEVLLAAREGLADPAYFLGNPYFVPALRDMGSELRRFEYNPDRARELLAEAGFPNGLTLDEPMGTLAGGHFGTATQVVQQQLANIGVTVGIEAADPAVFAADQIAGNYLFSIMGLQFNTHDWFWTERFFGTVGIDDLNMTFYSNPVVDEMFRQAASTADQDVRRELFREILMIVNEDAVILPLYHQFSLLAWDLNLHANPNIPTSQWYWR